MNASTALVLAARLFTARGLVHIAIRIKILIIADIIGCMKFGSSVTLGHIALHQTSLIAVSASLYNTPEFKMLKAKNDRVF